MRSGGNKSIAKTIREAGTEAAADHELQHPIWYGERWRESLDESQGLRRSDNPAVRAGSPWHAGTLGFQKDYLQEQLPDFEAIGVGRVDGREDGEMMAVFYRKSRFEKISEGHFWLSETPDQIGSKSWDSSLPRMVTWVTLRDRDQPDGKPVAFLNTHFDHRGSLARLESAKLLRQMIHEQFANMSIIVTGDFNTEESSPPYNKLFAQLSEADGKVPAGHSPVIDSFRAAHPQKTDHEGTFSGFNSAITTGPRIDWIGVSETSQ